MLVELPLATLLLLGKLDVLPDEVDDHILEGLRLDTEHLLGLARVGKQSAARREAIVRQYALLDSFWEVLLGPLCSVLPLLRLWLVFVLACG